MVKNIIREAPTEQSELSTYLDGDCFNEKGGDYCYTLFIVSFDRYRVYGFNIDEYERLQSVVNELRDGFDEVQSEELHWTYKDVIKDCGISFSPTMCHKLKEWYKHHESEPDSVEAITDYLTITTGKKWNSIPIYGYSQGDYCEVIYCKEFYSDRQAEICGEVWLGCAKEFCVIDLDENENEIDSCYGFIVADCEVKRDEEYKKIICEREGIEQSETRLELIEGCHTHTEYIYACY